MNKRLLIEAYHSIKNIIKNTPLEYNERLSKKYGCNLYIKREDLQLCRSFKIRGALYKIVNLSSYEKENGIVCASAGNHAQGVASSAKKFNISADIFVPSLGYYNDDFIDNLVISHVTQEDAGVPTICNGYLHLNKHLDALSKAQIFGLRLYPSNYKMVYK